MAVVEDVPVAEDVAVVHCKNCRVIATQHCHYSHTLCVRIT